MGVEVSVSSVPDSALAAANDNYARLLNGPILLQAATAGNVDLLETCLQAGVSIESIADDGSTPLHCSARAGQVAIVEILIQKEANLSVCNVKSRTPLLEAIMSQSADTVKIFFKDEVWNHLIHASPSRSRSHGLKKHLLRYGNEEIIIEYCRRKIADSDEESVVALMDARVYESNIALVDTLLHHSGIHFNMIRYLDHASVLGKLEIIITFLKHPNVKINQRINGGFILWDRAARWDQLEIAKLLLDQDLICANAIWDRNTSPLQEASFYGSARVVEYLLSVPGIDIYYKNSYGLTALQLAAFKRNWEIVHLILEQQHDYTPNLSKNQARFVKKEVQQRLLEHEDFEDLKTAKLHSRNTMLHLAVESGDCELIELLVVKRDIDMDWRNRFKRTPLHEAVLKGHSKVIQLLLQHPNIQLELEDCGGNTALKLARGLDRYDIVNLLLSYGAKDDKVTTPTSATNTATPQTTSFHLNNGLYPDPLDDSIYDEPIDDPDLIMEEEMSE